MGRNEMTHFINTDGPAEKHKTPMQLVGIASALLARSPKENQHLAQKLLQWIEPAIGFSQFQVFYDSFGTPVGYISWAMLAPDVEQRLLSGTPFGLHISEWTEGNSVWILDYVAPPQRTKSILSFARDTLFPEHTHVKYVRRKADGSIRKVVTIQSRRQKEVVSQ